MICNNKSKKIIIIINMLILCILFSCCSNPYLSENEKSLPTLFIPETQVPQATNTVQNAQGSITLGLYDLDTLNPLMTNSEALRNYLSLIYESLITYDKDSKPEMCLAEEITTDDGGFSWLITLKSDVYFHDDSLLTAYDVKNTIEWIKNNDCFYNEIVQDIQSIEIIKNNVLKIFLIENDSIFPSELNFPIIKSEDLTSDFQQLNGTGKYKQIKGMSFEIFDKYHGNFPKIKNIEILSFKTSDELYESNADIMMWYGDDVIKYSSKQNYSSGKYNDNILSCIIPSPNLDVSVKYYVNNLLEKENIVNSIYAGNATVKNIPIPEKTYFLNNFIPGYTADVEDVILPATLKFIVKETEYDLLRLVQYIENVIPKTVVVETLVCNDEEYNELIISGQYDFAFEHIEMKSYPDFYDLFFSSGKNNVNLFSNSSVDSLILSIKDAFKNQENSLVTNYDEFCNFASSQTSKLSFILEKELPVIPICQRNGAIFINKRLSGVSLYNFNFWNTLESFDDLYIK